LGFLGKMREGRQAIWPAQGIVQQAMAGAMQIAG